MAAGKSLVSRSLAVITRDCSRQLIDSVDGEMHAHHEDAAAYACLKNHNRKLIFFYYLCILITVIELDTWPKSKF